MRTDEDRMTKEEILQFHRDEFYGALKGRNLGRLAEIYSDDYMLVRPDGQVVDKSAILADFASSDLRFEEIELWDEQVRIRGGVAVLTGASRTVTTRKGARSSSRFRLIAVYTDAGDGIKLIHFQSTTLPNEAGS